MIQYQCCQQKALSENDKLMSARQSASKNRRQTYDRVSADGRLRVLELLLDAADDSLAVGADERPQNELRVDRVSSDDLSGDANEVADAIRGQVANLQLSVNVGEGHVVLLKRHQVRLENFCELMFASVDIKTLVRTNTPRQIGALTWTRN